MISNRGIERLEKDFHEMRIDVRVKPGARKDSIEKIGGYEFKVSIKKPSREGEANEAVTNLLAGYFRISKSSVRLASGWKSRKKVFYIPA